MGVSPFYTELFETLLQDVEKRMHEEGLYEEEYGTYKAHLQKAIEEESSPEEIVENYRRLFLEKKSFQLEKKLLEAFPPKEFPLKISRGLPRLYNRENPAHSHIKSDFSHLPSLKRLGLEKFLLPLYEKYPPPKGSIISLFTWMIPDGWGDWIAHLEIKKILKEKFPDTIIQSVAFIDKKFASLCSADFPIYYEKEYTPFLLPDEAIKALRSSDLILSVPTFYPHTEALLDILRKKKENKPFPRFFGIGQYGFLESSWFHPKSGRRSMGLHFLEKGILTRKKTSPPTWQEIENKDLRIALFGTLTPQEADIQTYLASHKLYLAYLLSPIGGAIYLHALLASQINNNHTIDICTPSIGWLIKYVEQRNQEGKLFFEENYGVQEVEVHYEGKIQRTKVATEGKKVRILCPDTLQDADFRRLVALSEEFIAVRGDQSFSEAISADRLFFYDGAPHARYFIKDLIAIAENRLSSHKSALSLFRCMGKSYLHTIEKTENPWVDETFFQEREPWQEIAKELAAALQNPATLAGYKKFNQILTTEYSCNNTLCHLVQREIAHHFSKNLGYFEEEQIANFLIGENSLPQLLKTMNEQLILFVKK